MSTTEASKPGQLTLHHLNNSQSQRILWLLEELAIAYQLEYNLVLYKRTKGQRAPPELAAIHPLGRSPILVLPDGPMLTESLIMVTYLLKTYDTRNIFGSSDWIRDETLCSFCLTGLLCLTTQEFSLDLVVRATPWPLSYLMQAFKAGFDKNYANAEYKKNMEYLEGELGDKEWFNGEMLGRADVLMSFPMDTNAHRGYVDFEGLYPRLHAWRMRILERPAWKRGLQKGNGYDFMQVG